MTFRHLISSAFVFAALCATASAQGLVREWTIPYPYGTLPSISSDGGLFARTLSTTEIVRYNGITGLIRDTVTTPFVESPDRVAFCGNTLYMLAGTRNDSLNMYRCAASATQCDSTPYTFRFAPLGPADHSNNVKSVGLYAVPHYPRVLLRSRIEFSYPDSYTDNNYGKCEEIDTTTFLPLHAVEGHLMSVSWSAEPDAFVRNYHAYTYDISSSPDYYTFTDWCTETHRGVLASERRYFSNNYGGESRPAEFDYSVHSGALHNIIYDTVVYDMMLKKKVVLPSRFGKILASLYPPMYVLKIRQGADGDVMSVYHYINGTTHELDTVPSCDDVWINGPNAVMYMLDTLSKSLTRYRIAPFTVSDTVILSVDTVRQKILMPIKLTVRPYAAKNAGHVTRWTVGDSTYVSKDRTVSMISTQIGEQPTSVMVVDTLLDDTLQARGPLLTLYRPEKNIMASNEPTVKRALHGCSADGSELLMSSIASMTRYHIPLEPADQAYAPTSLSETYAFGAFFTSDSLRLAIGETRGSQTLFSFYNSDVTLKNPTLVDTLSVIHAPPSYTTDRVRFDNRSLYNPELGQHITLFRVSQTEVSNEYLYDGVYLHPSKRLPKGRWLLYGGLHGLYHRPTPEFMFADASYRNTILVTGTDFIRSVGLYAIDTLFKIDRSFVGSPVGAFQIDSLTIVTTNGILKLGTLWERVRAYSFTDGFKVFRMDKQHSLVLRKDRKNIASVIDHRTGSTVEDIGEGFGVPIDAAYDPARNLLHVIDTYNIISTYTIGTPVSVEEEHHERSEERRLLIHPLLFGQYSVSLPDNVRSLAVFDLTGRCVVTTDVDAASTDITFDMPPGQGAGVYVVVAHGAQGPVTATFVHQR
jgi:hypothetical protein